MDFIGVVCEYNPFHNGHEYHLRESARQTGGLPVVCVMSGDFVQRGEAALYAKHARAEAAVRGGADVVFELPLPWALASAESFARGAVGLLGALGATTLSFGTESEDMGILDALARRLLEPETVEAIRAKMADEPELSFAAARQRVLEKLCGEGARALETPNNILAVEYLKAISALNLDIRPLAIRRLGSAHDGAGEGSTRSAADIRSLLLRGENADRFMGAATRAALERDTAQGRGIPSRARRRLCRREEQAPCHVPRAPRVLLRCSWHHRRHGSRHPALCPSACGKRKGTRNARRTEGDEQDPDRDQARLRARAG